MKKKIRFAISKILKTTHSPALLPALSLTSFLYRSIYLGNKFNLSSSVLMRNRANNFSFLLFLQFEKNNLV